MKKLFYSFTLLFFVSGLLLGKNINQGNDLKDAYQPCSVTIFSVPILCNGDCNGSITAVANGVPPFHYLWSNNDTTSAIFNLCAGNYSVIMTDSVGCIDTAMGIITEPPPLISTINSDYSNCMCTYTINVIGGTPQYTYLWCDGSIGQSMTNCIPGVCLVVVVDANGCINQDTLLMNPPPPLSLSVQMTGTSCIGCSDGAGTATASGGNPPYTYVWSSGQTTPIVTGLASGIYTVCVTDVNNCTICDSVFVTDGPSGILPLHENNLFSIYPNPFSGQTIMSANPDLLKKNPVFIITDVLGNKIISIPVVQQETIIERKHLSSGMYFYQLDVNSNKVANGKLIIVD